MSGQTCIQRRVTVYDHRSNRPPESQEKYTFGFPRNEEALTNMAHKIKDKIGTNDFVLTFPNRVPVDPNNFTDPSNGDIFWILNDENQKLNQSIETSIKFTPHYHTLTQSGMYEYYDSRGIDSLVISLAELIDNSLSATKANKGIRQIEIRYYDSGVDSMVVVVDNGHGMDFNQLWDWARFKYSKFERNKNRLTNGDESILSTPDSANTSFSSADLPLRAPVQTPARYPDPEDRRPRYLDSEINYFGAGGKQAVFNIGTSTTMVTKTARNDDVLELTLSSEKFEKKAQNDIESVYHDKIQTRSKGVDRDIGEGAPSSQYILSNIITEMEKEYKNFTICCVQNVFKKHQDQFRKNIENNTNWTKGLARIYHYYLHGPKGNVVSGRPELPNDLKDIRIHIEINNVKKSNEGIETSRKHSLNLKDITDDFETLLVQKAADSFEFEVEHTSKPGVVIEGIIRYYPYLYDCETLPLLKDEELAETSSEVSAQTGATEANVEDVINGQINKTRHREVFECFWHGRLIPQDLIDFEWTKFDSKKNPSTKGYEECYNRLSGALFTNHAFQVSQNKQSFLDFNKLMTKSDHLTFYRVSESGNRRRDRQKFEKEFENWIKECYRLYDKQVNYMKYKGEVSRNEFPSLKKNSSTETYSVFEAIDWRDKVWKKGQIIQTKKTKPQGLIGRINRFLVPKCNVDPNGNFMGSPGFVEIYMVPEEIYGEGSDASKVITFSQINASATETAISQELDKSFEKLPQTVEITFPKGNAIEPGSQIIAGNTIGDFQVILKNMKGDKISDRLPFKTSSKKICIQAEILEVLEDGNTECEVEYEISHYSKEWDYWFCRKDDGILKAGNYRLLAVCLCLLNANQSIDGTFANKVTMPQSDPIDFTVIAAPPEKFTITSEQVKTSIGKPFDLTLNFTDDFGNDTKPDSTIGLPQLSIENSKFRVTFTELELLGDRAVIKTIVITGPLNENQNPVLKVSMPAINKTQEVSVTLQKGIPSQIRTLGTTCIFEFINGDVPDLAVLLFDRGGNEVTFDKHYTVSYKIIETTNKKAVTPQYDLIESMHQNRHALVADKPLVIKGTDIPFNKRKFSIKLCLKNFPEVCLEKDLIVKKNNKPSYIRLYFTNKVNGIEELIELPNGETREFPANSTLEGIKFKAFDCDDSPIDLKDFSNQTVVVNWHNKQPNITFLINENGDGLPNIQVQKDSSEQKLMTFSWKQEKKGINIDYAFYLKAYPDCAHRIDICTDSHNRVFPLGEVVPEFMQISILDAFNNPIRSYDIMRRLIIRPITQKLVVDDKMKKTVNTSVNNKISFIVSHIKIVPNPSLTENDSAIGETRLEFTIQGMEDINQMVDINVINGAPHHLNWLNQSNYVTQMKNKRLDIRYQLCDTYNNPIIDYKTPIILNLDQKVFDNKQLTAQTDENGVAIFSETIKVKKDRESSRCIIPSELSRDIQQNCPQKCFGFHKIKAITKYKQKEIHSNYNWMHLLCDNKNPVHINYRRFGDPTVVAKSRYMPNFTVHLFAEDRTLINDFDANKIELQLIDSKDESKFQTIPPVPPFQKTFKFKFDRAPLPGLYKVKFVCYGIERFEKIADKEDWINAIPGPPEKLMVRSDALKNLRVVTNHGLDRHILESNLVLDLTDKNGISIYENISDRELDTKDGIYSGYLLTKIINYHSDTDQRTFVPELEGCPPNGFLRFPIKRGRVFIHKEDLRLKENTQGQSNTPFILEMTADLKKSCSIIPFQIKIMFCDDTQRQQQLNEIQNNISVYQSQRDELQQQMDAKKERISEQKIKFNRIRKRETDLIYTLEKNKEKSDLNDAQKIEQKCNEYEKQLNLLTAKQSECRFRGQQIGCAPDIEGVIGKLAQILYIQDEGLARSVSWFLRNHMECVVVKTAQIAEQLSEEEDIQSILSLDSISEEIKSRSFIAKLPQDSYNRTPLFRVNYSMSYLRTNFKFNTSVHNIEDLENILISILGDTLYIPDLQKAKTYRKTFEERIRKRCPTIVSKDGIQYESGITETLPKGEDFVCFQSPPDREYIRVQKIWETLKNLSPLYRERVEEWKKLDVLEKQYIDLIEEKGQQIKDLDQTIRESKTKFADISHTTLDLMDDDSNHSSHSVSRNSSDHYRRKSYRSRSRSQSREPKRSRRESRDSSGH